MRIAVLCMTCLIVISVLLASCGPAATTTPPTTTPPTTTPPTTTPPTTTPTGEPQYGGTLRVIGLYTNYEPTSWDHAEYIWTTGIYTGAYQETLLIGDLSRGPGGTKEFAFDDIVGIPDDAVIGQLATSWENPDPLTIIFHIRHGVMWQNKPGVMQPRELTASDVVYCWNRMLKSPKVSVTYNEFISSVEATDKYTVVFHLKMFQANWRRQLGYHQNMFVYPPELVQAGAADWKNAVGTGPFMLKDYVSGASLTYEKNPNYWGTTTINGKEYRLPFVDRLVTLVVPDESTRLAALRTAKVDINEIVSWKYRETLTQNNPELMRVARSTYTTSLVGMRMDTKPFGDIKVRKALSMAVDRQSLNRTLYGGEADILYFPYPGNWPETLYTPLEKLPKDVQEQFEYNPERAKQLLAEAGYPKGFETEMLIQTSDADLGSFLVAYWKNVGVNCKIDTRDASTYLGVLRGRSYTKMILTGKSSGCAFEPILVTAVDPMGTYNASICRDAYLNAAYWKALSTTDETEQKRLCKELNVYYLSQSIFVLLPTPHTELYYWPWVKNYHGEVTAGTANRTGPVFARAWIDSALKEKLLGQQ